MAIRNMISHMSTQQTGHVLGHVTDFNSGLLQLTKKKKSNHKNIYTCNIISVKRNGKTQQNCLTFNKNFNENCQSCQTNLKYY